MTFAASRKPYSCWGCEYFVAESPAQSYAGYCRRRAPHALDLYGLESGLTSKEFYHESPLAIGDVFPQTVFTMVMPSTTVAGQYLIVASYLWSMSGLTDQFWGHVITDANPTVEMAIVENGFPASISDYRMACGQSIQELPSGEQNIKLEIGRQPLGSTDNAVAKKIRVDVILIQRL